MKLKHMENEKSGENLDFDRPSPTFRPKGISFESVVERVEETLRRKYVFDKGGELVGIKEEIERDVEKRILRRLEKMKEVVVLERRNNKEAKKQVKKFIEKKVREGQSSVDDIEIMENLKIPIEQVDEIMEDLEKKGKIKEKR